MIRLSVTTDINDIILLWSESFGDSFEDIKFFLDEYYLSDNTVVCEYNGKVVSVLFLLDGDMHIKGIDYPSYYLYAACTAETYRGKGIMANMLEFAKLLSRERKKYFIALKPAEESLYNYYSKFGYKTVFSKKIAEIRFDFSANIKEFSDILFNNDYYGLRYKAFVDFNYFKWNRKSIEFAIRHHKHFGGEFFASADGYILYSIDDNSVHIKENTFSSVEEITECLNRNNIASKYDSIIIDLPYGFNHDKCKVVDSGMLLAVNNDANELIDNLSDAYLNLTLD